MQIIKLRLFGKTRGFRRRQCVFGKNKCNLAIFVAREITPGKLH